MDKIVNLLDVCNNPISDGIQLLKLTRETATKPKKVLRQLPIGKTEDADLNIAIEDMATAFIGNYYKYVINNNTLFFLLIFDYYNILGSVTT